MPCLPGLVRAPPAESGREQARAPRRDRRLRHGPARPTSPRTAPGECAVRCRRPHWLRGDCASRTGLTAVCPPLFLDAPNLHCAVVERMPLIPYLYAGAMKLVGDNALRVAVLKTAILDLLLLYFVARWLAIVGADRFTLMLIAFVFAGPQYMLHSFSPPRYLPFARGIRRDSIPQRRVRLARSRRLRLFPRCAPATSCARLAFDGQIAEVVQRMIWTSKRPSASLEPKIG